MNINESNNIHTQYLQGTGQDASKPWKLHLNNQATTETVQRITFNSQIACGTSNSGLLRSNNNSCKKGSASLLTNPNPRGTTGYAMLSNCNSPAGVHLNRSTYQQQKEAMQRANIQKVTGGGRKGGHAVRKQKKKVQ